MADYQFLLGAFTAVGVQVVGLSTDTAEQTAALRERLGLKFLLVCGLAFPAQVDLLGAYRHEARKSFQATGFIIDAGRTVKSSVYSTTNVGRLGAVEALRWVS